MYTVRLRSLGFNQIESTLPDEKKKIGCYRVYGVGFCDQVIKLYLRMAAFFATRYKPVSVQLESMERTKLAMTQKNIKRCIIDVLKTNANLQKVTLNAKLLEINISNYLKTHKEVSLQSLTHFFQVNFDANSHENYVNILINFLQKQQIAEGSNETDVEIPFYVHTTLGNLSFSEVTHPNWTKGILFFKEGQLHYKTLDNLSSIGAGYLNRMRKDFLEELKTNSNPLLATKAIIHHNLENGFNAILRPFTADSIRVAPKSLDPVIQAHAINFRSQAYIATAEPTQEMAHHFWKMAFKEGVDLIVKLTPNINTENSSRTYWPLLNEVFLTEDLSIKCQEEIPLGSHLCKRVFEVKSGNQTKIIKQLDFIGWPDFSVPNLKEFHKLLNQIDEEQKNVIQKPILVHCGAGIGRTGTLIAGHQIKKKPSQSISNTILSMRQQRPYRMVETPQQYAFLYNLKVLYQN